MQLHERIARLERVMSEGRLSRREFRGRRGFREAIDYLDGRVEGAEGVEIESIIAALVPEMEKWRQVDMVPPELMPTWMAWVTPWMEDHGRKERWGALVQTYASLLVRWDILGPQDWDRIELRIIRLGLLQLHLISRIPEIVVGLRAFDGSVKNNRMPERVRREALAALQAARARSSVPATAILDRAMGCFAEPDPKLARIVLNNACKMLPPKAWRRPGLASDLSESVLRIIEKEIQIKEKDFGTKSLGAPEFAALPAGPT